MRNGYHVTTAQGQTIRPLTPMGGFLSLQEAVEAAAKHDYNTLPAGVRVTDMWGHIIAEVRNGAAFYPSDPTL